MDFKHFGHELWDAFVPHEGNDHRPHFLRVRSVVYLAVIVTVFGLGAILLQHIIINRTDSLAAIIAAEIVQLTNADRSANSLGTLTVSPTLQKAAQMKADDMAAKSYFAHTSPDGLTPWYWFKAVGYNFIYAGENLAVRFSDSIDVERAWMNSPTHRANLLNTHFTEIGIGIAQGMYEGQPTVFVVQTFGHPAPTVTLPPVVSPVQGAEENAPQLNTTGAPVAVKGESTEIPEVKPVVPKVIKEDSTFIAVRNDAALPTQTEKTQQVEAVATTPAPTEEAKASVPESVVAKVVGSPRSAMESVYLVLSSLVWLSLIVMIVVEVKKQYPVNVALAVLLILLMVVFLEVGQLVAGGPVAVL